MLGKHSKTFSLSSRDFQPLFSCSSRVFLTENKDVENGFCCLNKLLFLHCVTTQTQITFQSQKRCFYHSHVFQRYDLIASWVRAKNRVSKYTLCLALYPPPPSPHLFSYHCFLRMYINYKTSTGMWCPSNVNQSSNFAWNELLLFWIMSTVK